MARGANNKVTMGEEAQRTLLLEPETGGGAMAHGRY